MLVNHPFATVCRHHSLKRQIQHQCAYSQKPRLQVQCTAVTADAMQPGAVADQRSGPLPPAVPPLLNIESIQHLQPCRQGCVVPYSPLTGPDAWYGREQQQQTEQWIHTLTTAQIAELEAAVALVQQQLQLRTKGNYLTGLMRLRDPDEFPLPFLQPVLARIKQELTAGRGFFLMKGLPVQQWTREQVTVAYWGIGIHLGVAIPQNQKGHLIGHVKDVGVDPLCQDPATRIYMTRAAQPWHVDSCDIVGEPRPCEIVAEPPYHYTQGLLCLQTAKSGGMSSWASSTTIYNEMLQHCPELVATLAGTWYLDRKGEVPADKLPFYVMPIVHFHKGYLTMSFHDSYYQAAAARFPDQVPPLTSAQQQALQLVNNIADRSDVKLDYWLEPGDMQFVNNHTIIHTRTQFEDWEETTKKRHLLRLQLVVPNLRPLPEAVFEELWGPLAAADRCAKQLATIADAAEVSSMEDARAGTAGTKLAAPNSTVAVAAAGTRDDLSARLAARFGGSGMGCIPLDAEIGNKLRG